MRLPCSQLHHTSGCIRTNFLCSDTKFWLPPTLHHQVCLAKALSTTRSFQVRFSTTLLSRNRPCLPRNISHPISIERRVRNQGTALAPKSSLDEQAGLKDVEESYPGRFDEPVPTEAGINALKRSSTLDHCDLLNVRAFCSRIQSLLCNPGHVVRFNDFPAWYAVLPVLAERLGLNHVEVSQYHPYRDYVSSSCHILSKPEKQGSTPIDQDRSLEDYLLAEISENHIQHWLRDFRENITSRSVHIWKLLMLVCTNSPLALPVLGIPQCEVAASLGADSLEFGKRSYQLRLRNTEYNVCVEKSFDTDGKMSSTFLSEALISYMEAMHEANPPSANSTFSFNFGSWDPAEFLSRGLSALGWGDAKFETTPIRTRPYNLPHLNLWEAKVHTPRNGQLGATVMWSTEKDARRMAIFHACAYLKVHLSAAYASGTILSEDYQVFARYWGEDVLQVDSKEPVVEEPLGLVSHMISINEGITSSMLEALRNLVRLGFQSTYEWSPSGSMNLELEPAKQTRLERKWSLDAMLYQQYLTRSKIATNNLIELPVRDERICASIREAIDGSDVTIITAATGSGKTTQVPQMILDQYIAAKNGSGCNIVCTQPRRVSTVSVATRVAAERDQPLGQQVGYKVRFDARPLKTDCGIVYMTSGYLLRLLEAKPREILRSYSHIILDEVHARDVDTDLILTALRSVLSRGGPIRMPTRVKMSKIILMSATIDAEFFQDYFRSAGRNVKISVVDVPGRMYDVQKKDLVHALAELQEGYPQQLTALLGNSDVGHFVQEQMNLTSTTGNEDCEDDVKADKGRNRSKDLFVPIPLLHLMVVRLLSTTESGDILVFLPGLGEIEALEKILLQDTLSQSALSDFERIRIYKLHSALYSTNYDVFNPIPSGCRRIVLATNIAETSITLPNVKFVVDTGLSRQSTYDQVTQTGTFGLQWISKAEVMQRKGRAGRTHAGVYYGVYSQAQYDAMADAPTPEILRTSLDHLVLRNASSPAFSMRQSVPRWIEGVADLTAGHALLMTPSPPEVRHVAAAAQQLHNIHALTVAGKPTAMGQVLSQLPVKPAAAKAVLLGLIFRCLDPLLVFGTLREDSPLLFDPIAVGSVAERRRMLAGATDDDKWADSRAFFLYNNERRNKNKDKAHQLANDLLIRHDAYCEYAQISRQTFEILLPMLGLHEYDDSLFEDPDMPIPVFPATPHFANTNSGNSDLVKALALSTSGVRLACWNHKNWRSRHYRRVLPHPKSVNHNGSKRSVIAQRLRRENGDLLSYSALRTVPKDKYPWLHETASATPLMAILFAESVSLVEEESAFIINGWVKYKLGDGSSDSAARRAAKIVWEYRKAIDRFLAHAMQMVSSEPHRLKKVKNKELTMQDFNQHFGGQDVPFRKIIVDSVIKVLEVDAADRADRLAARTLEEHVEQQQSDGKDEVGISTGDSGKTSIEQESDQKTTEPST